VKSAHISTEILRRLAAAGMALEREMSHWVWTQRCCRRRVDTHRCCCCDDRLPENTGLVHNVARRRPSLRVEQQTQLKQLNNIRLQFTNVASSPRDNVTRYYAAGCLLCNYELDSLNRKQQSLHCIYT